MLSPTQEIRIGVPSDLGAMGAADASIESETLRIVVSRFFISGSLQ
jgi:hypothetical protein